jgi:hydrogenase expression/formation protein HypC
MCLGVPGRIVDVSCDGLVATVDFFGIRRRVRLELVDEPVTAGDYILNHVGYAIRRIPEENIEGTLALYEQLLQEAMDDGGDLMAADVRGEVDAAASGDEHDERRGRR